MDMIAPIGTLASISAQPAGGAAGAVGGSMFESVFRSAIDSVKETDAARVRGEYLMATGQLDNPAELSIASSKYQIAVDQLVQLRNKALDAYSELMRISL